MTIDINLDRRLRLVWHHYQIQINSLKRNRRSFIHSEMSNNMSLWDATQLFDEEVRNMDRLRRIELDHIKSLAKAENKEKQRMQEEEEEQRKIALSARREQRKLEGDANKNAAETIPPRRSRRLAKK
jgi:hypothetical protein